MDLSHLDDRTALLVVTLQLEDLRQLQTSAGKGKQRAVDDKSDDHHAQDLLEKDLENLKAALESRIPTTTTQQSNADDEDANVPRHNDRIFTTPPQRGLLQGILPSQQPEEVFDSYTSTVVKGFKSLFMTDEGEPDQISLQTDDDELTCILDEFPQQPESSAWAAGRKIHCVMQQQPLNRNCCACQDSFHIIDLIQAPCNHDYCGECIRTLFQNSLVDESLFPPRCCKLPVSPEKSILILGQELYDSFKAKEVEFGTKDRTYCHDTSCAMFIPPSAIEGKVGMCTQCNTKTCTECKANHHTGECNDDPGTQQVLDLAAQNGWQRCEECQRVIELNTGCYHMSTPITPSLTSDQYMLTLHLACPCKNQFCYLCGVKWKKCKCPQWSEERLMDRAEQLVNFDLMRRQRRQRLEAHRAVNREAEIEEMRRNIMETHECTHTSWRRRTGGSCAECHDDLPTYLFECTRCRIAACRRCRFNRL